MTADAWATIIVGLVGIVVGLIAGVVSAKLSTNDRLRTLEVEVRSLIKKDDRDYAEISEIKKMLGQLVGEIQGLKAVLNFPDRGGSGKNSTWSGQ